MKEFNENLDFKELLKNMKITKIDFVRGLGIVDDRFELLFVGDNEEIKIEIETNFRIRNHSEILLSFNKIFVFFCTSSLKSNFCIDKEIFLYFFAVENDNFKSLKFEEKQCKIYML